MKKAILLAFLLGNLAFFAGNIESQSVPYSKASKDLGLKPIDFGSQNQAQELLKLMNEVPKQNIYEISYKTEEDTVVFRCDLMTDTLIRIHKLPDGHGNREKWTKYLKERLKSAASGGSLNDTPKGKILGVLETF